MREISIRKATIDDLAEIQKMSRALFAKEENEYEPWLNLNWSFEEEGKTFFTKELTLPERIVFVAKDNSQIIGYLAASSKINHEYKNSPVTATLNNIFIIEEYRNQKIGSLLMDKFFKWCKEIKAKRATVFSNSKNTKGIDFYKQNRFEDWQVGLKIDLE